MRRWLIFSTLWLLAVAAATTFHVPWQRPHPTNPDLSIHLGYAPLWSHRFANIPAAHPDGFHLALAFVLALLLPATLAADNLIERSVGTRLGLRSGNARSPEEPSSSKTASIQTEVKILPFPSTAEAQSLLAKGRGLDSTLPKPLARTHEAL